MSSGNLLVRVERRIAASPERVFDAWIDPGRARVWMAAALQSSGLPGDVRRVEIDPRVGGRFFFSDLRGGEEASNFGTYLVFERPRELAFTWFAEGEEEDGVSTVRIDIQPDGAGSCVTLVHELAPQWSDFAGKTQEGWAKMLTQVDALASEPPLELLDTQTLRLERLLPGPIERVWSHLVDSEKRKKWLASGEIEARVGGRVTHLFRHTQISSEPTPPAYHSLDTSDPFFGTVTQWDPPQRLAYLWPGEVGESEVTFELTPEAGEVRLVLTHRKLTDKAMRLNVSAGWHAHLGLLRDELEGRVHRGFWSTHEELERIYGGSTWPALMVQEQALPK